MHARVASGVFFSSVALWRFDGSVSVSHRLSVPKPKNSELPLPCELKIGVSLSYAQSLCTHTEVSDATLNSSNVWFDHSGQRNSARTTPQYETNMFIVGAPQTQATLVTRMSSNLCAMQNFSVCAKRTLRCNQTNHAHRATRNNQRRKLLERDRDMHLQPRKTEIQFEARAEICLHQIRWRSGFSLVQPILRMMMTGMHAARKKRGTLCPDVCVRCIYICIYIYICIILGSHHRCSEHGKQQTATFFASRPLCACQITSGRRSL